MRGEPDQDALYRIAETQRRIFYFGLGRQNGLFTPAPMALPEIDMSKIAIPDAILRKPGALTDGEKKVMRTHCEIGFIMLIRIPFLRDAAEIVLAHQEFYDGSGYPRGLRGDQIPLGARILSIANALDAMLSDWPYRKAVAMSQARGEIQRCAGPQFDPKIVETFSLIPENEWIELSEKIGSPFPRHGPMCKK